MKKLILTVGISGSGKSTWAKEQKDAVVINRDDVRFNLFTKGVRNWDLYKFTKQREKDVSCFCENMWNACVYHCVELVIVSDTNLNPKYHTLWKERAEKAGYEFELKFFPITLEEAYKRDLRRGGEAVGREVLNDQWQKWLNITNYKRYVPNTSLPEAVIVDIDGTVALTNGRSHYDYTDVSTDVPRWGVIRAINNVTEHLFHDKEIVFLSGRTDSCYHETRKWIKEYVNPFVPYSLHMRATGDTRNDRIVKEELFWEHIAPYYNVIAAFDDRPRVVRLWQDLGIETVFNVQKGYGEF